MLPLHAAHPTQHNRDTFAIRPIDHRIVRDFEFPTEGVQPKVLDITEDGTVPFGIVLEQKIGGIYITANQVIAAIDLEIEIPPTTADSGDAVVLVTTLRDLANAEIRFLGIGGLVIQNKN
jgi:hypothetical protein